jgi:hypothetical protein
MCHMLLNTYTIYTRPLSVRAQYSRLCPISGNIPFEVEVEVEVTLRLTVGQSVSLRVETQIFIIV